MRISISEAARSTGMAISLRLATKMLRIFCHGECNLLDSIAFDPLEYMPPTSERLHLKQAPRRGEGPWRCYTATGVIQGWSVACALSTTASTKATPLRPS